MIKYLIIIICFIGLGLTAQSPITLPELLSVRFDAAFINCAPENCAPRDCTDPAGCNATIEANQSSQVSAAKELFKDQTSIEREVQCDPNDLSITEIQLFVDLEKVSLPLEIVRIRLCGGDEYYINRSQLENITGPVSIIEEISITSYSQTFDMEIEGVPQTLDVEGFLELVFFDEDITDEEVHTGDYVACGEEDCRDSLLDCSSYDLGAQADVIDFISAQSQGADPLNFTYPLTIYHVELCGGQTFWITTEEERIFSDNIKYKEISSLIVNSATEDIGPTVSCDIPNLKDKIIVAKTDPTCDDPMSGSILITTTEEAVFTSAWYSIDGGDSYQTSPIFQGLEEGEYTIRLTDANGSLLAQLDEVVTLIKRCDENDQDSCTDGIDNDLDGLIDCADEECALLFYCTQSICDILDLMQVEPSDIHVANLSFVNDQQDESEFTQNLDRLGLTIEEAHEELKKPEALILMIDPPTESQLAGFRSNGADTIVLTPYDIVEDLRTWNYKSPTSTPVVGSRSVTTSIITDSKSQLKSDETNECDSEVLELECTSNLSLESVHIQYDDMSFLSIGVEGGDVDKELNIHIYESDDSGAKPRFVRSYKNLLSKTLQLSLPQAHTFLVIGELEGACVAYSTSSECLLEERIVYNLLPGDPTCFSKGQFAELFNCPISNPNFCLELGNGQDEICLDGEGEIEIIITDGTNIVANPTIVINIPEDCNDEVDNDGDGLIDCHDPECGCPEVGDLCFDGIDNDGIGGADCADPKCSSALSGFELSLTECTDGVDNDCDGLVDFDDPDCYKWLPDSDNDGIPDIHDAEGPDVLSCDYRTDPNCANINSCTDGLDNDGDGLLDCQEPACKAAGFTNCQARENDCGDGYDNDEDGMIDCLDSDCIGTSACESICPISEGGAFNGDCENNECYPTTLEKARNCHLPWCDPMPLSLRISYGSYSCETNRAIYYVEVKNNGHSTLVINSFSFSLIFEKEIIDRGGTYYAYSQGDTEIRRITTSDVSTSGLPIDAANLIDPKSITIDYIRGNSIYGFSHQPDGSWKKLVRLEFQFKDLGAPNLPCFNIGWQPDDARFSYCSSLYGISDSKLNPIDEYFDMLHTEFPDQTCFAGKCGYTSEGTQTLCSDGVDNDADGLVDCADPDCRTQVSCLASCEDSEELIAFFNEHGFRSFDVVLKAPLLSAKAPVTKSAVTNILGEQTSIGASAVAAAFLMEDVFTEIGSQNEVPLALLSECDDEIADIQNFMQLYANPDQSGSEEDPDHIMWAHLISTDGVNGTLYVGGKTGRNRGLVKSPTYQDQLTRILRRAGPDYNFNSDLTYSQIFMTSRLMSADFIDRRFDAVFPTDIPTIDGIESNICSGLVGGISVTPTGHPIGFDEENGRVAMRFESYEIFNQDYDLQALAGFSNRNGIFDAKIANGWFVGYQNIYEHGLSFYDEGIDPVVGTEYNVIIGSTNPALDGPTPFFYEAKYLLNSPVDKITLVPDFNDVSTIRDRKKVTSAVPQSFSDELNALIAANQLTPFLHEGFIYLQINKNPQIWIRVERSSCQASSWDCFLGNWKDYDELTPDQVIIINHLITVLERQEASGIECDLYVPKEALTDENITPGSYKKNEIVNYQGGVVEYATGYGADLVSNVFRSQRLWDTRIKYIVSAEGVEYSLEGGDGGIVYKTSKELADEYFLTHPLNGDIDPDLLVNIFFDASGGAQVCYRYNETYFGRLNNDPNQAAANIEKSEVKEVLKNGYEELISYKQNSGGAPSSKPYADNDPDEEFIDFNNDKEANNPWYYFWRRQDKSFFALGAEFNGVAKSITTNYRLPKETWLPFNNSEDVRADDLSFFDLPGGVVGIADAGIEENPVAQVAQMVDLVKMVWSDKEARDGLLMAAKEPWKTARAIIDDQKDLFTDPNVTDEEKQYAAGKLGTQVAMMIATGGASLIDGTGKAIAKISDEGLKETFITATKNTVDGATEITETISSVIKNLDISPDVLNAFLTKMRNLRNLDVNIKEKIFEFMAKADCPANSCELIRQLTTDIASVKGDDILALLKSLPAKTDDFLKAWDKIFESSDSGIKALRLDVPSLKKFDDLVQSNNLGLDADGLKEVLNSAAIKGQMWEVPDKILDAIKRASDANIPGLKVSHKKFPQPRDPSSGGFLIPAKNYQKAASLDAGLSFEVGGRSFDNITPDGVLVDRKYGHGNSIFDEVVNEIFDKTELVATNQTRIRSLLKQAKAQLEAAGGHPIRWEISTSLGAEGIDKLFKGELGQFLTEADFVGVNFSSIMVVHKSL